MQHPSHSKGRFVDLAKHVEIVRETVDQVSARTFASLAALSTFDSWTIEIGDPHSPNRSDYCQVEVELLDTLLEEGLRTLHLPVTVYATDRTLGTDVFVREDGQVEWNGQIYEFVDGVPSQLELR
jgi:hypothetical protein